MAATPPSNIAVQTPSTPRLGAKYDGNHARSYATRKSTRQALLHQSNTEKTPAELKISTGKPQSSTHQYTANRSTTKIHSPPSSTQTSPKKKSKTRKTSEVHPKMDVDGSSSRGASPHPLVNPANTSSLPPAMNLAPHMLPTPVKTPRKKQIQQNVLKAGGRILFPDRPDDPMPASRKNRKGRKSVGFSLYGSMEEDDAPPGDDILIYTDSKDKVPELDQSEDNPFLEKPRDQTPPPEPTKGRGSRKPKSAFGLDGSKEIEEAFKRDEGMVYVFRGKKMYRKFPEEGMDEDDEEDDAEETNDPETRRLRPLRRAAIKPRLLFPSATQQASRHSKSDLEDEEAPTDIDDASRNKASDSEHADVETPVKDSFAPSTPPDTTKAVRNTVKKADGIFGHSKHSPEATSSELDEFDDSPKRKTGKKVSPFDSWARKKAGAGSGLVGAGTKGKKRSMDLADSEQVEVAAKKAKATAG